MDRCAIFVDAEYLYKREGEQHSENRGRGDVQLYCLGANEFLADLAKHNCGLNPLRTYWYDTDCHDEASPAQQQIATLPNMKLRLLENGAATNPSEFVRAAIKRDLLTLAENRAIREAFLLSDDENLRDCVATAQDLGVRVALMNIEDSEEGPSCVDSLKAEVDEVISLSQDDLLRFMRRSQSPEDAGSDSYDPLESVSKAASTFADEWLNTASDEEFDALCDQRPRIPESLDGDLLYAVERVLGGTLRGQDRLRRTVRQAFWNRIDEEIGDWPPDRSGP